MHEGQELASILPYCRIEPTELARAWNELFPREGGQIPRTDLTVRWLTEDWTIDDRTHSMIRACLQHIMDERTSRLADYMATGIVGSVERMRIDALVRPLQFVKRQETP
jgi:hypothetical protein